MNTMKEERDIFKWAKYFGHICPPVLHTSDAPEYGNIFSQIKDKLIFHKVNGFRFT
jgi:hypothetical protein